MARKKDERAIRTAHRKEQQMLKLAQNGDPFVTFAIQLGKMGLEIRDIPGDGNCLFRALGDQLEGHGRNHLKYRHDVVEFIRKNRADFEPFVEDDVPFDRHISMLSKPGTYAGNDCIVAFARIHGLTVIIHQLDSPLWQVHGDKKDGKQLHISYHNGDHYASIRKVGDKSENPASIKLSVSCPRRSDEHPPHLPF
ncbi:hypothetical protein CAPTEDRAFT_108175 [Capitella teleta]|uniref:OTU domain-containing protein 3 n=1 Tax=Capitella teleta TaxID=283909 RepID=R7V7X8_CAPTE|nr:hypothetical protein CAPTEDRAFT_108175 [Capitella teleta]|eukprot:ELU14639.1 hypothetical protein CAPTEDRAFT_108175 [Capitella teleta]